MFLSSVLILFLAENVFGLRAEHEIYIAVNLASNQFHATLFDRDVFNRRNSFLSTRISLHSTTGNPSKKRLHIEAKSKTINCISRPLIKKLLFTFSLYTFRGRLKK